MQAFTTHIPAFVNKNTELQAHCQLKKLKNKIGPKLYQFAVKYYRRLNNQWQFSVIRLKLLTSEVYF